eukprot:jgi/Mesvir1/26340/Mv22516-RA.1
MPAIRAGGSARCVAAAVGKALRWRAHQFLPSVSVVQASVLPEHSPNAKATSGFPSWEPSKRCHSSFAPYGNARALLWPLAWDVTAGPRGFSASAAAGEITVINTPIMGESITEGTIAKIIKGVGQGVKMDEPIAQIETDKVSIDVKAPADGVLTKWHAKKGDTVNVGEPLAEMEAGAVATAAAPAAAAPSPPPPKAAATKAAPPPPPKAKAAEEAPSSEIPPPLQTGDLPPPPPPPSSSNLPPASMPNFARERRVPMTRLRKRVAQRLKDSQNTFAMLTTYNEIDMTEMMNIRKNYQEPFTKKHGVKIGFMSVFIKAVVEALKAEPSVNAVIDGENIVYRDYYDISVAVATPKGLVVPVLRGPNAMSFADIEKGINELGSKARDGTLSVEDMAGGTFTISNGGVYGSLLSSPIINPPQSAILGMHAINMRPMVVDGAIVARPMMYVALTYDHRLIDGREAVTFLKRVKDIVEDPVRVLLDC